MSIKTKVKLRAKHFRSLTYRDRGISTKTATQIYKAICRPLLDFGAILFTQCRPPALRNFQVAERSALRTLTKLRNPNNPLFNPSNDLLYSTTKVIPISQRSLNLAKKFATNPNTIPLIRQYCTPRNPNIRPKFKYPIQTLFEFISSPLRAND